MGPPPALAAVTEAWVKVLLAPPVAQGGEVGELTEAFVQMVRDIDQSQQNLVRASKLAVVGEMSSVIAHEVRTPLGILRSSAQMLHANPASAKRGASWSVSSKARPSASIAWCRPCSIPRGRARRPTWRWTCTR